jgi:hypothetical protein
MFGRNSVSDANLSDSAWFGLLAKLAVDQGRYSAASKLAALANEASKLDPRQTTEANRAAARDALFGNQVVAVPKRGTTRDEHPTRPGRVADVHPLQPAPGDPILPNELARFRAEFDASRAQADHPRRWFADASPPSVPSEELLLPAPSIGDQIRAHAQEQAERHLGAPAPVLRPFAEARMDDTAHTAVFTAPPAGSRAPQYCAVVFESLGSRHACGALIGFDAQLQGWFHQDPEITDHAASAVRFDQG